MSTSPDGSPKVAAAPIAGAEYLFCLYSRRKLLLFLTDCVVLFGTAGIAVLIRALAGGSIHGEQYMPLLLLLFVAPIFNYFEGIYSAPPPALPEELRILGVSTSLAYFCIAIFLFLGRGEMPSRLVFLGAWLVSMGLVPLVRCQVRAAFAHKKWWGVPTVLFGDGALILRVEEYLSRHVEVGLRPQALFSSSFCDCCHERFPQDDTASCGLQRLESEEELITFANSYRETCAVVVVARDATLSCRRELIDMASQIFPEVILVPEDFADGEIPLWVRPLEMGSVLCLKVRQNLLDPRRLMLKRMTDLVLSLIGGTLLLPLFALIALAVRVESSGPAFFRQERIGCGGSIIRILKFRTMVSDAETVLQKYLADNPEMRKEWEADQKLRDDPRITRVGAFLRRTSLDELPQLWNVVCGEMSLVGPRPIVREEVERYGSVFKAYMRVRPGITGLWQVSGRNNLSYKERVHIDSYYICNWSTWLDILILARTIPAVLRRSGAY